MIFDVVTIFPGFFQSPLAESLMGKALEKERIKVRVHNLRDFANDKHRMTDDYPYGGGVGMVMKPEPVIRVVEKIKLDSPEAVAVLLTPQGERLHQGLAKELSKNKHWILICGRYEGLDERIRLAVVNREISIGDYILTGGELASLVFIDVLSRYVPGFMGCDKSIEQETFADGLLEYPQYTRPPIFRDLPVPEVLLSGNHAQIERWRRKESLRRTFLRRPDLLEQANLSNGDLFLLEELKEEKKTNNGQSSKPTAK